MIFKELEERIAGLRGNVGFNFYIGDFKRFVLHIPCNQFVQEAQIK